MTHTANIAKPIADMSEDEFTEWLRALPPPPESDENDFAESIARARADVAAGRVYSHELVGEWLKTAGNAEFLPIEEWLARRNDQSPLVVRSRSSGIRRRRLCQKV